MPQTTGISHPSYDLTRLQIGGLTACYAVRPDACSRTAVDYELVVIDKGLVACELDGDRFVAPPGSLVLIRPRVRVKLTSRSARRAEFRSLRFQLSALHEVFPEASSWPRVRVMAHDPLVPALTAHVFESLAVGSPAFDALARNALRHVLAVFLTTGVHPTDFLGLPEPVERALSYTRKLWEQNALRSPSLGQLAAAAGVSTGHLTRLFRGSLGVAPLRALRRLRLEKAANELLSSRRTIKEIAYEAGFGSQFHFSRCFKKSFGDTPSAFRDRLTEARPPGPGGVASCG